MAEIAGEIRRAHRRLRHRRRGWREHHHSLRRRACRKSRDQRSPSPRSPRILAGTVDENDRESSKKAHPVAAAAQVAAPAPACPGRACSGQRMELKPLRRSRAVRRSCSTCARYYQPEMRSEGLAQPRPSGKEREPRQERPLRSPLLDEPTNRVKSAGRPVGVAVMVGYLLLLWWPLLPWGRPFTVVVALEVTLSATSRLYLGVAELTLSGWCCSRIPCVFLEFCSMIQTSIA